MFILSHESNVNITLKNYFSLSCSPLLLSRENRDERREERKNESGGQNGKEKKGEEEEKMK